MFGPPLLIMYFYDLRYLGYDFTWCNFQESGTIVEERLDRFYADHEWSITFLNALISHIDSDMSDLLPILLKCYPHTSEKGA